MLIVQLTFPTAGVENPPMGDVGGKWKRNTRLYEKNLEFVGSDLNE